MSSALGFSGAPPPTRMNMARYCLARQAARVPDKLALLVVSSADADDAEIERWSYGQLDAAVRGVGGALRRRGLDPRDRVLIRLGNTSEYALVFFGAIAAGLTAVPASAELTDNEALFLLRDSGAKLVVSEQRTPLSTDQAALVGAEQLLSEALGGPSDRDDYENTAADAPAYLIYTSGTTGQPKGVLHAQRAAWGRRPMLAGWYGGLGDDDVVLHAGAFNWTYTLGVGLTDPWACGASAVIYNGPKDPSVWPALIERFGATLFAAVPGLYRQMLKYADLRPGQLSSLRHGLCAGEALRPGLSDAWRRATGKLLYEALGMSECSTYISSNPSLSVRPGSPGKPQPGRCVAVLPVDGGEVPLPSGQVGLLAVHRSDPGLMLGYWNRPNEEAEVYRGAWFVGGDLASFDEDGYLHFHGRNDDVMNALGYRVAPLEVERCLARHPMVAELAVVELPVRDDVSVIGAFVVPNDPDEADAAPLLELAARELARYKCPREVIFVDQLPRTPNGKVQRRRLIEHYRRQ